jgi:hypothetical protein
MPSENWNIIDSRKERLGSCGQKGISNVSSTSLQASLASLCGRVPMPVVKKGVNISKILFPAFYQYLKIKVNFITRKNTSLSLKIGRK